MIYIAVAQRYVRQTAAIGGKLINSYTKENRNRFGNWYRAMSNI